MRWLSGSCEMECMQNRKRYMLKYPSPDAQCPCTTLTLSAARRSREIRVLFLIHSYLIRVKNDLLFINISGLFVRIWWTWFHRSNTRRRVCTFCNVFSFRSSHVFQALEIRVKINIKQRCNRLPRR